MANLRLICAVSVLLVWTTPSGYCAPSTSCSTTTPPTAPMPLSSSLNMTISHETCATSTADISQASCSAPITLWNGWTRLVRFSDSSRNGIAASGNANSCGGIRLPSTPTVSPKPSTPRGNSLENSALLKLCGSIVNCLRATCSRRSWGRFAGSAPANSMMTSLSSSPSAKLQIEHRCPLSVHVAPRHFRDSAMFGFLRGVIFELVRPLRNAEDAGSQTKNQASGREIDKRDEIRNWR